MQNPKRRNASKDDSLK